MKDEQKPETIVAESYLAAVEMFFQQEWTDGLPIVPPTPQLVWELVESGGRAADEFLGELPERDKSLAVWQAATCAVMAGCKAEFFPVVLATWEALFDPRFNLHSMLSSTGGSALMGIVSGPYAAEIGMNARAGVFSPGNRANATIGRAIRLGAMTALGATPGLLDASSFGHPGKFSWHFAEDRPVEPWIPLNEQLGYLSTTTTVTVLPTEAPRQVAQRLNREPEGVLRTIASCIKNPSQNSTGKGTYYVVVLGPEHAALLHDARWSQQSVREFLSSQSRISPAELAKSGILPDKAQWDSRAPGRDAVLTTVKAENILVITAGGPGAGWSAVVPCTTSTTNTHPVTRPVAFPGSATRVVEPGPTLINFR